MIPSYFDFECQNNLGVDIKAIVYFGQVEALQYADSTATLEVYVKSHNMKLFYYQVDPGDYDSMLQAYKDYLLSS